VESNQLCSSGAEYPAWIGGYGLATEPVGWDGLLVVARGELDVAAVPELRRLLAASPATSRILLDLAEVTFIDSLSLAAIVAAKRRLGDQGRLAVVADHHYVLLIFEAGGLDSVVEVFRTRDEAEAYLSG
jgi:anti-sigma B factor antagonist